MKRKRKFLLSFMLCVMGIFAFGTTAYAKAQLVELKVNKTYRTDVNGDGKKDRLKIVEKNIQKDYPAQCHRIIYINGKKVRDFQSYGHSPIYFYKASTANEYLIVGSHWKGGFDDYVAYHCKKQLKKIGNFPSIYSSSKLSLSGNNIKFTTLEKGCYITRYRPVVQLKNGRLSLASKYAKVTGRKKVTSQTSFRTFRSVNSTVEDGFWVFRNQDITITKVYLKKNGQFYTPYYRIYTDGKYAWMTHMIGHYIYQ